MATNTNRLYLNTNVILTNLPVHDELLNELGRRFDRCSEKNGPSCEGCFNFQRCRELWDDHISPLAWHGKLERNIDKVNEMVAMELVNLPEFPAARMRYLKRIYKEDAGNNE